MEWWKKVTYDDKRVLTALLSCDGIGPKTIEHLLNFLWQSHFALMEFWDEPKLCSDNFRLSERQLIGIENFKKKYSIHNYLNELSDKNIKVIFPDELLYPPLLQQIPDYPVMLFVKGNLDFIHDFPIAVVGSRSMTEYGQMATDLIVSQLVSVGAQIISGGMYGIDTQAHQSCLKYGGPTVCVLGYGFDYAYPETHQLFFEELLQQGGTILTEFAPTVSPKPGNFPRRNRIVAGMSLGTVVIEAAKKSGSQITARLAAEYGREVFAVPGSITNPYTEGTKILINEGAKLVSSATDILEELHQHYTSLPVFDSHKNVLSLPTKNDQIEQKNLPEFSSDHHKQLFVILKSQSHTTDELCQMLQLPFVQLSPLLTELELEGLIENRGEVWQCK